MGILDFYQLGVISSNSRSLIDAYFIIVLAIIFIFVSSSIFFLTQKMVRQFLDPDKDDRHLVRLSFSAFIFSGILGAFTIPYLANDFFISITGVLGGALVQVMVMLYVYTLLAVDQDYSVHNSPVLAMKSNRYRKPVSDS